MRASNERLTILSEAEQAALYELPNFDNEQRLNYLNLTPEEQALMRSRSDLSSQIHCALQIGYFRAVHFFFRFEWEDVTENVAFVLEQYFPGQVCKTSPITKHQYYAQCQSIAKHFGYQMWSNEFEPMLFQKIEQVIRKDISSQFIIMELLAFLREKKIIRPGYSTLQKIISRALLDEKTRLTALIQTSISDQNIKLLKNLLQEEETLSGLAELKRDAKDFKARIMDAEREKFETIKPLYVMAKALLPKLKLSHQNISYYASLVHYYTIHDLRQRIKPEQSYLYLLCYIWERYRQLSNNLMDAFCIHLKQFEDSLKIKAKEAHTRHVMNQQTELRSMRRMAKYFVADEVSDETRFGDIRQEVFTTVISKEKLQEHFDNSDETDLSEIDFYWKTIDQEFHRYKLHLRPLLMALDFSSVTEDSPWLVAINLLKTIFNSSKQLNQCPISDCPEKTLPKRLLAHLVNVSFEGQQRLNADRYEFWIYRQLKKRIKSGNLHLEDIIHYRSLQQELQEAFDKGALIAPPDISALKQPIQQLLDLRFAELHQQWVSFNDAFTQGKLKHLYYDEKAKTLHFKKTNDQQDEVLQHQFYEQLPLSDIADVLRFVNSLSRYSSAFTHIQPRYSKIHVDENNLIATVIAQALNSGNLNMADISDIPYDTLFDTYQSRLRLQTLKQANDIISNDISKMPIFPSYSLDVFLLYAALDGQKYEVVKPTIKARHSKKYYGKGKGVVAYTMLYNHIPLQSDLIGAHDHESYYAFDIWYNNTSSIKPNVLTGDMHVINKGNFAIMDWFGGNLYPRFTNLETQTKHLYCGDNPKQYSDWTIHPIGQINRQLIEDEWPNIMRIIAALGLKEISQNILIKKLCTYTTDNKTRKAIFEYDKLIRSIYTLKYLQDRKMQRDVHRSQNRLESYHQLRAVIATTYGKKQLIGRNDRELEISNQCGRLMANAIIHYNSAILSKLKTKYEAEGNLKALAILKKISPVAWRHIHFRGHFIFSNNTKIIDLDSIVRNLVLQVSKNKITNKNKQDMYEYTI